MNAEFSERLVAEAPDGILHADQDGVIRYWNGGCERIFGFTAADELGQYRTQSSRHGIVTRMRGNRAAGFGER